MVRWRENGVHRKRVFKTREQAEEMDRARQPRVAPVVALYTKELRARGRSERYITEMERVLGNCVVRGEEPQGNPTTVNRYKSYMKLFFSWAVETRRLTSNPLAKWTKAKERPRSLRLTVQGLEHILTKAPPHLKLALLLQYSTGARMSDVLKIRWEDVDVERKQIYVWSGKVKAQCVVPVSDHVIELLKTVKRESEYVVTYKGERVGRLQTAWETARKGLEYVPCQHEVRHLFATEMLRRGADIGAVSKMLGHSSVKMTLDVYHEVFDAEKRRAVNLLPPIGGNL